MKKLNEIQKAIHVPKVKNENVSYKSRSCEDILEMVKPLLGTATLVLSDEIVLIGDRYYVKATATLKEGEEHESATAFAREEGGLNKYGQPIMTHPQNTGSTSSYARKYALGGLLALDDIQDDDKRDNTPPEASKSSSKAPQAPKATVPPKDAYTRATEAINNLTDYSKVNKLEQAVTNSTELTDDQKQALLTALDAKAELIKGLE